LLLMGSCTDLTRQRPDVTDREYHQHALGAGSERARFATTRWSLVIATREQGSPDAVAALATLCEAYWFPVYAFIRRSGRTQDAASDLTQSFFTRVLEKNYLEDADRDRGRFRTFLLASVNHFLANEAKAERALKRGGGAVHLSLETDGEERRFQYEPQDIDSPDRVYERRWAHAVLDHAMARLAAYYAESGRQEWFARLRPTITGDDSCPQAALALELGLTESALRVAIHRLRRRYADTLRDVIADTVDDPASVEDELHHLMAVVSR
jgi:DNA-directed RNA polymerase specialized sigma24 family protein